MIDALGLITAQPNIPGPQKIKDFCEWNDAVSLTFFHFNFIFIAYKSSSQMPLNFTIYVRLVT